MQIQGSYLIKELKTFLRKKKYKLLITKAQKFISKQESDITYMCASIFIKILFLQCKAVIKILQKNIIRKYPYEESIISLLVKILNRNIQRCYLILLNKIKDNQLQINQSYYNQKKYSYYQVNSFKVDLNFNELKQYCQQFQQIFYQSALYCLVLIKSYNTNSDIKHLKFVQILTQTSSKTIKCLFLRIQLNILICKSYIENGYASKTDKEVNNIIQEILIIFDRITKKFLNQTKINESNKFKYYFKKAFKLLMITSAIIVRIKMILNQEKLATQAIKIFNYQFQKCGIELPQFQKYLKPQIYVYGQYCQYQLQKSEIVSIIQSLFSQTSQKQEVWSNNENQNKNCLIRFYNNKMTQFNKKMEKAKAQNRLKKMRSNKLSSKNGNIDSQTCQFQNTTIKPIKQTKLKNISFGVSSLSEFQKTKKRNSLISEGDFYKPIFKQINQTNSIMLTTRKKQGLFFNPNQQINMLLNSHCALKNRNTKSKNVYIVKNRKIFQPQPIQQNVQKQIQKQEIKAKLQQQEYFFYKQLKYRKQKLKQKAKTKLYKTIVKNNILQDQQTILNFKTSFNSSNFIETPKIDSTKQIQPEILNAGYGNKIKQKVKHMSKKSKIQQFVDLLIQNKQYLGIKRLIEKIQYLKKKEELKEKFRSTRKTTSIRYQQGQFSNFSFLAQDIIKFSLEDWDQKQQNTGGKQNIKKTVCLTNQNNFRIGEKSIQILLKKLQNQKESFLGFKSPKKKVLYNNHTVDPFSKQQSKKLKKKASQWKCKFVL